MRYAMNRRSTVKKSTEKSATGGKKDHGSMFYVCLRDMLF